MMVDERLETGTMLRPKGREGAVLSIKVNDIVKEQRGPAPIG